MNITTDNAKYNRFQAHILKVMLRGLKQKLETAGLDEDQVYELVGDIGFQVGALFDGSALLQLDGEFVVPYLAFSKDHDNREDLLVSSDGSYLHELNFGCVDEVFEEEGE